MMYECKDPDWTPEIPDKKLERVYMADFETTFNYNMSQAHRIKRIKERYEWAKRNPDMTPEEVHALEWFDCEYDINAEGYREFNPKKREQNIRLMKEQTKATLNVLTTRVWLVAIQDIANLDAEPVILKSIDEFFEHLKTHAGTYYFHNLAFDGSYIVDKMTKMGIVPVSTADYKRIRKDKVWFPCYECNVDGCNSWYTITIHNYGKSPDKNGKMKFTDIKIRDSLKKINSKVSRIAKDYGVEQHGIKIEKGEIDYDTPRPEGYTPTEQELKYIAGDVKIVAYALQYHLLHGDTALTAAADAKARFIESVGSAEYARAVLCTNPWEENPNTGELKQRPLSKMTSVFADNPEIYKFVSKAYIGGLCVVNPTIIEDIVYDGQTYDYNSMYPSMMVMYKLPLGQPGVIAHFTPDAVKWTKPSDRYDESNRLWIANVYIKARLKQPVNGVEFIPCMRVPGLKWYASKEDYWEGVLHITSIDYEVIQMCYDVEFSWSWAETDEDGYPLTVYSRAFVWDGVKGFFDRYINYYGYQKIHSPKGSVQKANAKLKLNSLYGKFGMKDTRMEKVPRLVFKRSTDDSDKPVEVDLYGEILRRLGGYIKDKRTLDDKGKLVTYFAQRDISELREVVMKEFGIKWGDICSSKVNYSYAIEETVSTLNVAISAFVTAYARRTLVYSLLYDIDGTWCYCDTDSIHFIRNNGKLAFNGVTHDNNLGAWKLESTWKRAKFIRQKTYCEEVGNPDGTTYLDVKACGLPDKVKDGVKLKDSNFNEVTDSNGKPVYIAEPVNFDEFVMGAEFGYGADNRTKLSRRIIPGGCGLIEGGFRITEPRLVGRNRE